MGSLIQKENRIEECLPASLLPLCTQVSPDPFISHFVPECSIDDNDMYFWYDGPQMWRSRGDKVDYFVELLDECIYENVYTELLLISPNSPQTLDKAEKNEIPLLQIVRGETGVVYILAYRHVFNDIKASPKERYRIKAECCVWELASADIPKSYLQDEDVYLHPANH